MKIKITLTILTVLSLTACSFNKIFLKPTKVPLDAEEIALVSEKDTSYVLISGDMHQPTFLKNGKDTINLDFTIESVVFKSSNGNNLNG